MTFQGGPPYTEEEWRQIRKMLHEWREHGQTVVDLDTVLQAAGLIRRTIPYVIFGGISAAIAYNWHAVLVVLQ